MLNILTGEKKIVLEGKTPSKTLWQAIMNGRLVNPKDYEEATVSYGSHSAKLLVSSSKAFPIHVELGNADASDELLSVLNLLGFAQNEQDHRLIPHNPSRDRLVFRKKDPP